MANLDWPAFGNALWLVSDRLGIRPEWQLPVIYLETAHTFDPAVMNSGGCVGLNQFCPSTYSRYVHVPVNQYRTWTASAQLSGPILAYWRDALTHGPIDSAARLMLAQLGQGLLATTPAMNSVVFSAPSAEYSQNAGFDTTRKGYFTLQDLADVLAKQARAPEVQEAIGRAYAMRPNEVPSEGYTFSLVDPPTTRSGGAVATLVLGTFMAAVGYGTYKLLGALKTRPERSTLPPPAFRRT
jgi:hypothetical protein